MTSKNLVGDESGADLIEYALIVGIVAFGVIAVLSGAGGSVERLFDVVIARLNTFFL